MRLETVATTTPPLNIQTSRVVPPYPMAHAARTACITCVCKRTALLLERSSYTQFSTPECLGIPSALVRVYNKQVTSGPPGNRASVLPIFRGMQSSSTSTSTSDSPDPSSRDHAVSALQQQLLLMVARRTQPDTPRVRSSVAV